ncbi:MAG TPA: LptE family protein [Bacteroidota bacterium]|nr:LptE family protein [Bacteroidota bacterium]
MHCSTNDQYRCSALLVISISFLSMMFSGCTYSFKGGSAPANLKTIVIPVVDDQSGFGDPTLRDSFTQKIIKAFTDDNSLQVTDRNSADSMLEIVITDVKDVPLVLQGGENVSTRRITVTVRATFQDLKQRKKLWEKSFSQYGDYPSGGGLTQRAVGVTDAVSKLAEDILNDTVAGW